MDGSCSIGSAVDFKKESVLLRARRSLNAGAPTASTQKSDNSFRVDDF